MKHSSGKSLAEPQGTQCSPCNGNATSVWFFHGPLQILVTSTVDKPYRCWRTNAETSSIPVSACGVCKSDGALREKWEWRTNHVSQNCSPSVMGAFATHTGSQTPRGSQGASIPVGLATWWLHIKHFRSYSLPGRFLLLRSSHSACYTTHHKYQCNNRVNHNWKRVQLSMYRKMQVCQVWCVLINQISQKKCNMENWIYSKVTYF